MEFLPNPSDVGHVRFNHSIVGAFNSPTKIYFSWGSGSKPNCLENKEVAWGSRVRASVNSKYGGLGRKITDPAPNHFNTKGGIDV